MKGRQVARRERGTTKVSHLPLRGRNGTIIGLHQVSRMKVLSDHIKRNGDEWVSAEWTSFIKSYPRGCIWILGHIAITHTEIQPLLNPLHFHHLLSLRRSYTSTTTNRPPSTRETITTHTLSQHLLAWLSFRLFSPNPTFVMIWRRVCRYLVPTHIRLPH